MWSSTRRTRMTRAALYGISSGVHADGLSHVAIVRSVGWPGAGALRQLRQLTGPGRTRLLTSQELLEAFRGHGRAEEIPLEQIAAVAAEEGQLLRGLDSLRGDLQAEPVGESDHRRHQRGVVLLVLDVAEERAIDLEAVDRERCQLAQTRVPGAEVVDGAAAQIAP